MTFVTYVFQESNSSVYGNVYSVTLPMYICVCVCDFVCVLYVQLFSTLKGTNTLMRCFEIMI
jgi:hypothetical protein